MNETKQQDTDMDSCIEQSGSQGTGNQLDFDSWSLNTNHTFGNGLSFQNYRIADNNKNFNVNKGFGGNILDAEESKSVGYDINAQNSTKSKSKSK